MSKLGRGLIKSLREATSEGKGTWKLYKDKPILERISMVLYTCDLLDPVFNTYYSIRGFIKNCIRVIDYIPIVWRHRDWDYGFVLKFNKKLHEDLYKGIYEKGHHVFTKKDARRLKTVIALYDRLREDDYDEFVYAQMEKKYGVNDFYFTKVEGSENKPGGPYSTMRSTLEDRQTPEQRKKYWEEKKALYKHCEQLRVNDFELLGKYLAKYSKKWWD